MPNEGLAGLYLQITAPASLFSNKNFNLDERWEEVSQEIERVLVSQLHVKSGLDLRTGVQISPNGTVLLKLGLIQNA